RQRRQRSLGGLVIEVVFGGKPAGQELGGRTVHRILQRALREPIGSSFVRSGPDSASKDALRPGRALARAGPGAVGRLGEEHLVAERGEAAMGDLADAGRAVTELFRHFLGLVAEQEPQPQNLPAFGRQAFDQALQIGEQLLALLRRRHRRGQPFKQGLVHRGIQAPPPIAPIHQTLALERSEQPGFRIVDLVGAVEEREEGVLKQIRRIVGRNAIKPEQTFEPRLDAFQELLEGARVFSWIVDLHLSCPKVSEDGITSRPVGASEPGPGNLPCGQPSRRRSRTCCMSSQVGRLSAGLRSRAAGWYVTMVGTPSTLNQRPRIRPIGSSLPSSVWAAIRPSATITRGWISSIWRSRYPRQAITSSPCGSRLPGG